MKACITATVREFTCSTGRRIPIRGQIGIERVNDYTAVVMINGQVQYGANPNCGDYQECWSAQERREFCDYMARLWTAFGAPAGGVQGCGLPER